MPEDARKQPRRARRRPASGTGRSTYLTPETTDSICRTLRIGNYLSVACDYAGVGASTVYRWLARGRRERDRIAAMLSEGVAVSPIPDELPFLEFLDAVTQAEAEAETFALGVRRQAMSATTFLRQADGSYREVPDWNVRERAASRFHSTRYSDRWGESPSTVVSVEQKQEVRVSAEELRTRAAEALEVATEVGAFEALDVTLSGRTVPETEEGE